MNAPTKHIMPAPRVADLEPYDSDWTLIPLHKPGSVSVRKGKSIKDGKRPLHSNWTKRKYAGNDAVALDYGTTHNIGVRLRKDQLIVDVDPRNGGMESLKKLKKLIGTDFKQFPRVVTGSGGFHYYMAKPKDLKIVGSLPELPGIDFKSKGGQVVVPGSVHPDTGKFYEWDAERPALSEVSTASDKLLDLIARKEIERDPSDETQLATPEELAGMLAVLDPENYRDQKAWLDLMMACHHATSGDGREEFIEWSTQDPEFSDDRGIIGRRWDSLSHERQDGITARTLYKAVSEAGHPELCPQADPHETAKAAFEGLVEDKDADGDAPPLSPLERLNRSYYGVIEGGRFRVMRLKNDPDRTGQKLWLRMPKNDFFSSLAHKPSIKRTSGKGKKKKTTYTPLAKAWFEWKKRNSAIGTTLNPNAPTGAIIGGDSDDDGALNLWTGWGVEPREGDWSKFRAMIREVICNHDEAAYEYLLNWIAWKFQNPALPMGAATVLKGGKGAGKTTLGKTMVEIFGSHGIVVTTSEQLAGKFSGHMAGICFAFADEAFDGKNNAHMGTLKKLITDEELTREGKGIDAERALNPLGMMIAINEWNVPATPDERRYFVLNPSTEKTVPRPELPNDPNRRYWNELYAELGNGGREAFLFSMLNRTLPHNWRPSVEIPNTKGLVTEIVQNLQGLDKWWHRLLQDGEFPVDDIRGKKGKDSRSWQSDDLHVSGPKLVIEHRDWLDQNRIPLNITEKGLLSDLKKYGVYADRSNTQRFWFIPKLKTAKAIFKKGIGGA